MLRNAPVILGALTVGGALVGLPLAVLGYYLAYMAVNKYQQRVKEQMAIQKARMLNTKKK